MNQEEFIDHKKDNKFIRHIKKKRCVFIKVFITTRFLCILHTKEIRTAL